MVASDMHAVFTTGRVGPWTQARCHTSCRVSFHALLWIAGVMSTVASHVTTWRDFVNCRDWAITVRALPAHQTASVDRAALHMTWH